MKKTILIFFALLILASCGVGSSGYDSLCDSIQEDYESGIKYQEVWYKNEWGCFSSLAECQKGWILKMHFHIIRPISS